MSRITRSFKSRCKTFRIRNRARLKRIYSSFVNHGEVSGVIWIFGCQRSGTTFLENIFRHDLNSAVFGEFSELTIGERKTVLKDLVEVKEIVLGKNAKYAVIRPLFESDRAVELLDLFPNSIGVWLFRDCPHVVDSMIRKWDDRFFEISRAVESGAKGIWRLESLHESIKDGCETGASTVELYARYWYARNSIPYEQGLIDDPRMIFMSYPTFVSHPRLLIADLLARIGFDSVWKGFRANARKASIDRPVNLDISEETLDRCNGLYDRLLRLESNSNA